MTGPRRVFDAEDFDCTYEEWVTHLRKEARSGADDAAGEEPAAGQVPDDEIEQAACKALRDGLEDGSRIEQRDQGWVVVDRTGSFLADPHEAQWIVTEDDHETPPAYFESPEAESPEAAYRGWLLSEAIGNARQRRRERALKQLGKL